MRAVFLDRDGVLNRAQIRDGKPYAPRHLAAFRLLPGTAAALVRLRAAGLRLVVVTNQPDIGNGLVDSAVVEAMHARLRARLPLDAIEVCPHRQDAGCDCRKPNDGMLRRAASRLGIDLAGSYMVGDRWSDIVAGQRAGCYTFLVDRGYREGHAQQADQIVKTLPQAVDRIVTHSNNGSHSFAASEK